MTSSENFSRYIKTSPYFAQSDQENADRRNAFLDRFDSLPDHVREFLLSPETSAAVDAVADQYSLSDDQGEFLARVVREVVAGTITIQEIAAFVAKKFNVDNVTASTIAQSLTQNVLSLLKNMSQPQTSPLPAMSGGGNTLNLRTKDKADTY